MSHIIHDKTLGKHAVLDGAAWADSGMKLVVRPFYYQDGRAVITIRHPSKGDQSMLVSSSELVAALLELFPHAAPLTT